MSDFFQYDDPGYRLPSLSYSVELQIPASSQPGSVVAFQSNDDLEGRTIVGIGLDPLQYGTSLTPSGAATPTVAQLGNLYLTIKGQQTTLLMEQNLTGYVYQTASGIFVERPKLFAPFRFTLRTSYVRWVGAAAAIATAITIPFQFYYITEKQAIMYAQWLKWRDENLNRLMQGTKK